MTWRLALAAETWPVLKCWLSLDQTLLMDLGSQARWLLPTGRVPSAQQPDYLADVYPDALLAVRPETVSMILPRPSEGAATPLPDQR